MGLPRTVVCGMLMYSSRGSVMSTVDVCLADSNCRMVPTQGKLRTLSVMGRGSIRLILVSVVVPIVSNVRTVIRVEGVSGIPIVLLATGDRSASGMLKLAIKTSSCIAGPFGPMRLRTEIGSRVEECVLLNTNGADTKGLMVNNVRLSSGSGAIAISNRTTGLAHARCSVLGLLVRRPNRICSPGRVCTGI